MLFEDAGVLRPYCVNAARIRTGGEGLGNSVSGVTSALFSGIAVAARVLAGAMVQHGVLTCGFV